MYGFSTIGLFGLLALPFSVADGNSTDHGTLCTPSDVKDQCYLGVEYTPKNSAATEHLGDYHNQPAVNVYVRDAACEVIVSKLIINDSDSLTKNFLNYSVDLSSAHSDNFKDDFNFNYGGTTYYAKSQKGTTSRTKAMDGTLEYNIPFNCTGTTDRLMSNDS
ncbi:hypothetical protein KEM55_002569 [Ascosphaera atra]|nr:hypothetical protein KEM55_002569 [Ascosphaera atra]